MKDGLIPLIQLPYMFWILVGPYFALWLPIKRNKTGWVLWWCGAFAVVNKWFWTLNIGEEYRKIGDRVVTIQQAYPDEIIYAKFLTVFVLVCLAWHLNAKMTKVK